MNHLDPAAAAPSPDVMATLLPTKFCGSWFPRARPGDVFDTDPARRAAAWAHWLLCSLAPMTGSADRPYTAVLLPSRFYDPKGTGPRVQPHLEVPGYLLDRAAPEFPDRVAQIGNGILFPWWLVPETLAVKRALFSVPRTAPTPAIDLLNGRRVGLRDALIAAATAADQIWSHVEDKLVTAPEVISDLTANDFTADEVASYWPAAADLGISVEFDRKLRTSQGTWVSRRVGVWRIVGADAGSPYALGVVTPRLTRSSLFNDTLFDPATESPAACLVRGLVLRRIVENFAPGGGLVVGEEPAPVTGPPPGLRAVVARVGEKLPEASVAAALKFLRAYPDPQDAWTALATWADARGSAAEPARAVLTVTRDGFVASHAAATRAVRRAEDPDRDDINVVLPLAWDASARVVRLTYAPR